MQERDVRVALVDDHKMVRVGLRSLLESSPGFTVVGEAGDGREAVGMVGESSPDVVLMDLSMPDVDGIAATRSIVATHPDKQRRGIARHLMEHLAAKVRCCCCCYVLGVGDFFGSTLFLPSLLLSDCLISWVSWADHHLRFPFSDVSLGRLGETKMLFGVLYRRSG